MLHRTLAFGIGTLALAMFVSPATAQQAGMKEMAMHDVAAADLAYSPVEVPGFLSGMQIAVLHGDPSVPDESYTLRLALPDGYKFPPHFHPRAEHVTVMEGTFLLAMGQKYDGSKLKTYKPGDYLYIAAKNPHFGQVRGRTVVQLHGIGPFDILVVEGQAMSP